MISDLRLLNCIIRLALFTGFTTNYAQEGYVWMKGPSSATQVGLYGTIGVGAAGNNPGGREGAMSWKDASGNYWLMGGYGTDFISNLGYMNDMWKYNTGTNQWTWVKGDNIIAQTGVYGTLGVAAPANKPGARSVGVTWQDAGGNVYLFGGYGYDAVGVLGYLNDLWRYNPSNNQWTWLKGSNQCYQPGNYGSINVPSASNIPGARFSATGWTDASGNLWLFGGFGNTTTSLTVGFLNDVWKYDIAQNEWTWMKGASVADQNGSYGTLSVSSASNTPGGRRSAANWQDGNGNLWLFGGEGFDATSSAANLLNDLWKFEPATNEWIWLHGSNSANANGAYGTLGVNSATTVPGARNECITWKDINGTCWMGFGWGLGATGSTTGKLSDLWQYNTVTNQWTWMRGPGSINFPAIYGNIGNPSSTNIPGSRRASASWSDAAGNLWLFGGFGQPASGAPAQLSDLWKYTNCYISPITLTISSSHSVVCAGEPVTLSVTGSNNYTWSHNLGNTASVTVSPSVTTTFTAYTTNSNTCLYSSVHTQSINACISLKESALLQPAIIYPNPGNGNFNLYSEGHQTLLITDQLGKIVFEQSMSDEGRHTIESHLSPGIYYWQLISVDNKTESGKLLITAPN